MLFGLPRVQPLEEALSDCLCAQHMTSTLQDHDLEDDELLSVTVELLDSRQLRGQCADEAPAHFPLGVSYWHDVRNMRSLHHACHCLSYLITLVRWQP